MPTTTLYPYRVTWVGLLADGTDSPDRRGETSLHAADADDAIARVDDYGDRRSTGAVEL
jgi:hypothetical protein